VYFLKNGRASYVEPLLPAFYCGMIGLLIASVWSYSAERHVARVGFATLGLAVLWVLLSPSIVVPRCFQWLARHTLSGKHDT
jgi:hypothetical protein